MEINVNKSKILVIGSGSIGQRHIRNLHAIGIKYIGACDPDPNRLAPMVEEIGVQPFANFDRALELIEPDVVFVCTPPIFHIPQALKAIKHGAHVFIEKPLSHNIVGIDELVVEAEARQRKVQVGYNLRFHPGLQMVKELIDYDKIGCTLWARAEAGQYLPDWRPWQDYRQSYTARQDMGGGIILDGSHEIDYIIWLLGKPIEVACMAGKVSKLEVDVEDCASILLRFANGVQADIHIDFIQQGYSRSCKIVGENGTIIWDYAANEVSIYSANTKSWETKSYTFSNNDMYMLEIRHFIDSINNMIMPSVDLQQAELVLRVALAAKSSALSGFKEVI